MLDTEPFSVADLPALDASEAEKDRQWRIWVSREIQRRVLLAQYVLDGLIAQMSGEPTSVRHTANQLHLPSCEAAFEAANSTEWLSYMHNQKLQPSSFRNIYRELFSPTEPFPFINQPLTAFSLRVLLEGLQSLVCDCSDSEGPTIGVPSMPEVRLALARAYDTIITSSYLSTEDRLETLLRWHSICLDTSINSATLCRHICSRYNIVQHIWKDNKRLDLSTLNFLHWTTTTDARRALLHACAIQEIVEQLPRGRAHVIHMPSSLFAASTIYSAFSLAGLTTATIPSTVDWKETLSSDQHADNIPLSSPSLPHQHHHLQQQQQQQQHMPKSVITSATASYILGRPPSTFGTSRASRNLLYELNSMQKLFRCLSSQWGVAFDMEDCISMWITVCH